MRTPPDRTLILVPLVLGAQAILTHWIAARELLPEAPDLSTFPAAFGDWRQVSEDPIAADVARELRADRLLSRTYGEGPGASYANLFVAWFQSQRGEAQPHSPKVCLPGAGWLAESGERVTLATAAGSISVNRMVIVRRNQRAVVLYWYQNPRRVTAGEWEAKLWVISDALRHRRTDVELVRVVMWQSGSDEQTLREASRFAANVYPQLAALTP